MAVFIASCCDSDFLGLVEHWLRTATPSEVSADSPRLLTGSYQGPNQSDDSPEQNNPGTSSAWRAHSSLLVLLVLVVR